MFSFLKVAVTSISSFSSIFLYASSSINKTLFSISSHIKILSLFASGPIIFLSSFDKSFIPLSISCNNPFFHKKSFCIVSISVSFFVLEIFSIKSIFNLFSFSCITIFI
ncbi:MAG: hypothetical protein P1U46_01330 [Patescibacteria group bacterium]|nr:hypothetical protein [Patescibacteria group bacterium]